MQVLSGLDKLLLGGYSFSRSLFVHGIFLEDY